MSLVDLPTGDDDGQRAAYHILHCWYREHRGPDGETSDATHRLTGLYWNYARGTRGKEAVQDDMPCLWVWRCKCVFKFPNLLCLLMCSWEKLSILDVCEKLRGYTDDSYWRKSHWCFLSLCKKTCYCFRKWLLIQLPGYHQ